MTKHTISKIAAVATLATLALSGAAFAAEDNASIGGDVGVQGMTGRGAPFMRAGADADIELRGGPQGDPNHMMRPNGGENRPDGMMSATGTRPGNGFGRDGMMRGGGRIGGPGDNGARPAIIGTVTAINGTTLTVASRSFAGMGMMDRGEHATGTRSMTPPTPPVAATTTYTVDASAATVLKDNATSSIASILVGDRIVVRGSATGTQVVATQIIDGKVPSMMGGRRDRERMATGTPSMNGGDGQNPPQNTNDDGQKRGFFGNIGHFFKGLFGF